MKGQLLNYEQNQQNYETVRLGVRERNIDSSIDKFCILTMHRPQPYPPLYAILTNHEIVYIFNHKFGTRKGQMSSQSMISQNCETKINLRLQYKLPLLLHVKMKYSYNTQCVFMVLSNSQIAVFTQEFYLLGCIDIVCCDPQNSIKYCLDFEYYEKQAHRSTKKIKEGYFIFLFTDSLEVHQVEISTNHKLSKFKHSYKISIVQLSKEIIDNHIKHPVNLTLFPYFRSHHFTKTHEKINNAMYLAVNCLREVIFYFISKDSMKIEQTLKISKTHLAGAHVMDIEISPLNKRMLFALNNGVVRAVSYKEETYSQVLYTIKISQSQVVHLYLENSQKLLTYSKDNILSVVSLQTLTVEQKFRVGNYIQFVFLNEHYFLGVGQKSQSLYNTNQGQKQDEFSHHLILNEFNCKYEKVLQYNSDILGYVILDKKEIIHFSDNSLLINQHSGSKVEVIQTYLPPRSVSVKCIKQNPFTSLEEYWILTQKSEIYKYNIAHSKDVSVSDVVQLYRFIDKNETQHRYLITYFCFLTKIVPMEYDSETTQKEYVRNEIQNCSLKPICLGSSTGQIIITSIDSIFNIICRVRSLSSMITNIIQVHPIVGQKLEKGLIIYESKRSEKVIISQFGPAHHPIEHFRLNSANGTFKTLSQDIFAIINQGNFSLYYTKQDKGECSLFTENHYTPGLIEGSKITTISLAKIQDNQYVLIGFSLGQIIIYRLHRNLTSKIYLYLDLIYLLEISKQEPIQFLRFDKRKIYFNLGNLIVWNLLPEVQMKDIFPNADQNARIDKNKGARQFNLSQGPIVSKKEDIKTAKFIEQAKQLKLPKIKSIKTRSNRSASLGLLKSERSNQNKPEFMFHFPDIQLYRNLISKSIIH